MRGCESRDSIFAQPKAIARLVSNEAPQGMLVVADLALGVHAVHLLDACTKSKTRQHGKITLRGILVVELNWASQRRHAQAT